ncbi:MAG: hypothetical protein IIA83_00635 [Thaumarchaeota archaeon]|nr:hypothetical protein [Nitrososphaerota archaeon]
MCGAFCPECKSTRGFDEERKCLDCGTRNISQVVTEIESIIENEPELMKTCRACNGQVPESRLAPCPLCGKSEGFSFDRSPKPEKVTSDDSVQWVMEGTRDIEIPIRHEKRNRGYLIIMLVSVILSGSFEFVENSITPFVMLTIFFISSIPFFVSDIMLHRRKVKIHSEKGMEFLD